MMRSRAFAPFVLAGALCACAAEPPLSETSHVSGASFRDVSALTVFIADILADSLPPANTTLRVIPLSGADPDHAAFLLANTLRERGFALSPDGMPYPGAHSVRYAVSPVGGNLMLELDADDASTTCLYGHTPSGALKPVGSCTSRNGASLALRIPATALPEREPVALAPAAPAVATHPLPSQPRGPFPITPPATAEVTTPTPAAAPLPRPIITQAPLPVWVLLKGEPVRDQMLAWGDKAGWTVIWPANREMNWIVPVTTSFTGRFDDKESGPLAQVIRTLVAEDKPLKLDLYYPNRTAVVSNTGVAQ
ncbi:MAG: toxin co-regulated pilus biosynthesis Q family protein [Gluconacetobacter sp.]